MHRTHLDRLELALIADSLTIRQMADLLGLSRRSAAKVLQELRVRRGNAGLPNVATEQVDPGMPHIYYLHDGAEDLAPWSQRSVSYLRTNLTTMTAMARSRLAQADSTDRPAAARFLRDISRCLEDILEVDS